MFCHCSCSYNSFPFIIIVVLVVGELLFLFCLLESCHLIKTATVYTCMYYGSCFCHIIVVSN